MKPTMSRFETFMKIIAVICLSFAFSCTLFGQTTITTTTAGAWTTNGNWSSSTAPSTTALNNIINVTKAMTFNSGSMTGYNSTTITIKSGGSITVTGNFDLTGSGIVITVQSGGSLTVSGTTSVTNNASITFQSGSTGSFATLSAKSAGSININSGATVTATSVTTTSNSDAIINNAGSLTVNGSVDSNGVVTNSGTMQVNGDFTQENSGNTSTNSGTLNVTGNVFAYGQIQLNPGSTPTASTMTINGSLTVNANPWMIVGTNVSSCSNVITNYANLTVKTNVILTGSGDVTVNQNGRFVVFGNVTTSGGSGGTLFTINCGGQAYVNGNVNFGTGGGNTVTNNNSSSSPTGSNGSPVIGLYVNGSTTAQTTTGTIGTKSQLQSNDLPFYNYIAGLSGSPLPVTLMFFKATVASSQAVELDWATANELNFDHFEIERSADGKTFEAIGTVNGHGTTSVRQDYAFTDNFPLSGISYYRLKSVDFDGYTEIFSAVAVKNETTKSVHVYPVPVENSEINVFFNFEPTEDATLVVLDLSGQEIERTNLKSGESIYHVTSTAKTGVYVLKIYSSEINLLQRIAVK
jgi:hypothetical protein